MPLSGQSSALSRPPVGRWWQSTREFFAYHGVWSFGVRAMRLWSLRMKMVLLVAVMAMPLLPLVVLQIVDRQQLAEEIGQRLAGLRVSQAVCWSMRRMARQPTHEPCDRQPDQRRQDQAARRAADGAAWRWAAPPV